MGLGFVMAVDPSDVEKVQTALNEINEPSYVVGKVTETGQVRVLTSKQSCHILKMVLYM